MRAKLVLAAVACLASAPVGAMTIFTFSGNASSDTAEFPVQAFSGRLTYTPENAVEASPGCYANVIAYDIRFASGSRLSSFAFGSGAAANFDGACNPGFAGFFDIAPDENFVPPIDGYHAEDLEWAFGTTSTFPSDQELLSALIGSFFSVFLFRPVPEGSPEFYVDGDVISGSIVPEPGTLALLGLGLAGMGLRRRVQS